MLSRLVLTDFRNHADLTLAPGPGFVVLTGENGAGKTNVLEAVSLLAPGRGPAARRRSPRCRAAGRPRQFRDFGVGLPAAACGGKGRGWVRRCNQPCTAAEPLPRPGPGRTDRHRHSRSPRQIAARSGSTAPTLRPPLLRVAHRALADAGDGPALRRTRPAIAGAFLDRLTLALEPGHGLPCRALRRRPACPQPLAERGPRARSTANGCAALETQLGGARWR